MKYKEITILIPDPEYPMSRVESYAYTAYVSLKALHESGAWRNPLFNQNDECIRAIPRLFYSQLLSWKSSGVPSGFTSVLNEQEELGTYVDSKGEIQNDRMVSDHYIPGQTAGEFVLDNPKYLQDFELFVRFFKSMAGTHRIKHTQNLKLAKTKHTIPSFLKYVELGIPLYDIKTKQSVDNHIRPNSYVCDDFEEDWYNWECMYVMHDSSKYGQKLPENVLCKQKETVSADLTSFFN